MINVKAAPYRAKGDAKRVTDAVVTAGDNTVTSATASFTSADVGKLVYGVLTANGSLQVPVGTITAVNSANSIEVSAAPTQSWTGVWLTWGTDDTVAIQAADAAARLTSPPQAIYYPAGAYILRGQAHVSKPAAGGTRVPSIYGEGPGSSVVYVSPGTWVDGEGRFVHVTGNTVSMIVEGIEVDTGWYNTGSGQSTIYLHGSRHTLRNVHADYQAGAIGIGIGATECRIEGCRIEGGYIGLGVGSAGLTVANTYVGNCGYLSVHITGATGATNTGIAVRIFGGIIDESIYQSLYVENSTDVVLSGVRIFSGVGYYALELASSSVVRMTGCEAISFGTNNGNRGGAKIAAGCTLYAAGTRFDGYGTLFAIDNAGTFNDALGNILGGTGRTGVGTYQVSPDIVP